jgi:hypothetical protein
MFISRGYVVAACVLKLLLLAWHTEPLGGMLSLDALQQLDTV